MTLSRIALLFFATAAIARTASADPFNVFDAPTWTRPASNAAASASLTTYQEWDGFTTATGVSPPSILLNPNAAVTTGASDSTSVADGAILLGSPRGDIYSFSQTESIHPQATLGGYGVAGNNLNVLIEVQSFGTIDPGLSVNGTSAANLPGYNYSIVNVGTPIDVGFGTVSEIDQTWSFSVPDTTSLELNWDWNNLDVAIQDLSIDTQSVSASAPVPEPASLGLLAAGAVLLLCKRRQPR